jgi:twinkle protein
MSESVFKAHSACSKCGSSDANAVYDDGHTFCFSCSALGHPNTAAVEETVVRGSTGMLAWEPTALVKRGLTEETCRKWHYGVGSHNGLPVQVANYYSADGHHVAQKVRTPEKKFHIRGDASKMGLYGEWLWRDGGRMLVVTEGEIDALTVSQVNGLKWPVVSVPNGAQGAAKAMKKRLEWLDKFETIVLMFDMDEPGKAAAAECAQLFPPGKVKIANLPGKDPNELLKAGLGQEIIKAQWEAKTYRPDGVLDASGALDLLRGRKLMKPIGKYPHTQVEANLRGLVPGQIVTVCAGSGIGKTEFVRQFAHDLITSGLKVGYVALEESVDRTAVGIVGVHLRRRLYLEDDPASVEGFEKAWSEVIADRVFFYDHFGSMDADTLISKIRYMRVACGVDVVILDHVSIVVSGIEDGEERRTIDNIMTRLRALTEQTGAVMLLVSHLKRPMGTPHEEGGRTALAHLRGSAAIGQLSDVVLGLERDQQGEHPNIVTIRILKSRRTGITGVSGYMRYDPDTGALEECMSPELQAADVSSGGAF